MQVFRGISVVAFHQDSKRVTDIQSETTETSVTEDQLILGRIETLRSYTREPTEMQFNHTAQIKTEHETRRNGELHLFGTRHTSMTHIAAELKAAIQMTRA